MSKVSVPALREFTLKDGRSFVRGEMVEVEAIEAAALSRKNLVSLTKQAYTTREMSTHAQEPDRPRRRYRRRDMKAETE